MRLSTVFAAPLLATAYAASSVGTTTVSVVKGTKTILSTYTYTYSNPVTSLLTETNSAGVITGKASPATSGLITSQPSVATIPAGLPKGETVVYYNASGTLESFSVSVGKSTTVVLSGKDVTASQSAATGTNKPTGGAQGSSSSTTSGNAAPTGFKAASAGILGVGAFIAALL